MSAWKNGPFRFNRVRFTTCIADREMILSNEKEH